MHIRHETNVPKEVLFLIAGISPMPDALEAKLLLIND